jgi:hypothetical protein
VVVDVDKDVLVEDKVLVTELDNVVKPERLEPDKVEPERVVDREVLEMVEDPRLLSAGEESFGIVFSSGIFVETSCCCVVPKSSGFDGTVVVVVRVRVRNLLVDVLRPKRVVL